MCGRVRVRVRVRVCVSSRVYVCACARAVRVFSYTGSACAPHWPARRCSASVPPGELRVVQVRPFAPHLEVGEEEGLLVRVHGRHVRAQA